MKEANASSLVRKVKGRMGAFLRTKQFDEVHREWMLTSGVGRKARPRAARSKAKDGGGQCECGVAWCGVDGHHESD